MYRVLGALIITNPFSESRIDAHQASRPADLRSFLVVLRHDREFHRAHFLRLDRTITIGFSTPLMVAALAGRSGEWIGPRRWAAIGVGFLGVIVMTRPASAASTGRLLSFSAMLAYAA